MLPRIVVHKKNGHHPGPKHAPAVGEILRQVHSGGPHVKPTYALLKFATVVRTEKRTTLLAEAVRRVDGLRSGLNALLARTEVAFERGEFAEVRETLEALRVQAGETTRLFARLLAGAETRTSSHGLVEVNDLVARAAERASALIGAPVSTRLDPSVPAVIGNAARLERAIVTFAAALNGKREVSIDAAQVEGAILGETLVRVIVSGATPLPPAAAALGERTPLAEPAVEALDIHLARQIIAEHGGVTTLAPAIEGVGIIRIELPAV
jgi:hypothetical protein